MAVLESAKTKRRTGRAAGLAESDGGARRDRGRQPHLEHPTEGHLPEDVAQAREGELETDGEQEKHHADFGEHLDGLDGPGQAEAERPEDGPRREETATVGA